MNMQAASPMHTRLNCTLHASELAQLCCAIENAFPNQQQCIVQFASAYAGEGTERIAFETAIAAATLMGKRVLYMDILDHAQATPHTPAYAAAAPQHLQAGGVPGDAVAVGQEANLFYTVLHRYDTNGTALTNFSAIRELFERLRPSYDLIIIDASGVLNDIFGMSLAKLVDGTILVIEAERTRAPVVLQTRDTLQKHGGRVIGAVLNKRRFYIPNRLYRLLYRRNPV